MQSGLDRIDFGILTALQNNARLANKELAARVGLAPSSCLMRVRRLMRDRVLRGFRAEVEPKALGIGLQALVFVRLTRHARRGVAAFRRYVLGLAETVALYHVGGQHDFLVHVATRDADQLRDLAMDAFTVRPEVARIETHLIFEHAVRPVLPFLMVDAGDARASRDRPLARRGSGKRSGRRGPPKARQARVTRPPLGSAALGVPRQSPVSREAWPGTS
jgi:DNA-binding Lrp family transcriptional regulator